MSIATEITRLQGIKTDIRTALVTQGIAQAISHNMVDFSSDILAIQGGSEGVYITVTCDSAYQGYDIILSANKMMGGGPGRYSEIVRTVQFLVII